MRNGTHFNKLTLVDHTRADHVQESDDDTAVHHPYQPQGESINPADQNRQAKTTFFVLTAVSIACATAAVATGSYAAWLARQSAARQALTDVNDILMSCQTRMRQLEADVQRLPNRQA